MQQKKKKSAPQAKFFFKTPAARNFSQHFRKYPSPPLFLGAPPFSFSPPLILEVGSAPPFYFPPKFPAPPFKGGGVDTVIYIYHL